MVHQENEIMNVIRGSFSEQEVRKCKKAIATIAPEYSFKELKRFRREIKAQREIFKILRNELPHEKYPPFALENHIQEAKSEIMLKAIQKHLFLFGFNYPHEIRMLCWKKILNKQAQLVNQKNEDHD
ncbi:MAG TPA: hypothetical protein VK528_11210 [Flavobacterium sp.]|nr:hypothetical protein [Flavobacterium sp.]